MYKALCKEANLKYPISGNATHDAFHRQFSGPDSFYVIFSGSEKLSPPDWYHAGHCLYVFPFHISNPGKLSLDITHLYDTFGAVVEQTKEWPILRLQKVVNNVRLEICRGCPSRFAEPRFSQSKNDDQSTTIPFSDILLTGTMTSADRLEETFGSTTMTYIHDPLYSSMGEKSDILVANMGHWATGTKFLDQLWSTTKYHDKLRDLVDSIQQRARNLQGLEKEDEDLGFSERFLDDEYDNGIKDFDGHEDEDDEDELELEREILRQEQQEAKETQDIKVYWGDETEEPKVETRPRPGPSPGEQEEQDELDDLRDKYRVKDRLRAEGEGKHLVSPERPQGSETEEQVREGEDEDERIPHRYRHAAMKNVLMSEDNKPTNDAIDSTGDRNLPSSIQRSKSHILNAKIPAERSGGSTRRTRRPRYRERYGRGRTRITRPASSYRAAGDGFNSGNTEKDAVRDSSDHSKDSVRYRKARRMDNDIDQDPHNQESLLKIAWVGMVAYPETQAAEAYPSHDWRTIYRLRYWNQIAEEVMLLHNVRFMDFFSMTLSMLDISPDRGHYFGSDASEAMLEELAFKLGLCDDSEENEDKWKWS
ncbi:hypothetical protein BGX28_007349 [Mortierella sp. GBA30]|nr:hypothetical protein BGX28_007349 [Mortierella sp. GBA30]